MSTHSTRRAMTRDLMGESRYWLVRWEMCEIRNRSLEDQYLSPSDGDLLRSDGQSLTRNTCLTFDSIRDWAGGEDNDDEDDDDVARRLASQSVYWAVVTNSQISLSIIKCRCRLRLGLRRDSCMG